MQSLSIVDLLDERADRLPHMRLVAIGAAIHLLAFQGAHEAFSHRIVPRAAGPAHARLDASPLQPSDIVPAGILNPAIGVMDQPVRTNVTARQCHVQRLQCQTGAQMRGNRPPHHPAAERIEDHRQIDEFLAQPDIRDVRHPQLVHRRRHQPTRQIRIDQEAVPAVRRRRAERFRRYAQQIILPPDARDPLVIDCPARALQQHRQPPIPVMPLGQRQTLDLVAHRCLLLTRGGRLPIPVVAGPADAGQLAQPFDLRMALRRRLRVDHRVEAVAPGTPLAGRCSLTCRKAA